MELTSYGKSTVRLMNSILTSGQGICVSSDSLSRTRTNDDCFELMAAFLRFLLQFFFFFVLVLLFQVSIGRQWKEFLDYSDSVGFIFHVR